MGEMQSSVAVEGTRKPDVAPKAISDAVLAQADVEGRRKPDGAVKEIDKYFAAAVKLKASDLHMKVGQPPLFRVGGTLRPANAPPFTLDQLSALFAEILGSKENRQLEQQGGADFAYSIRGVGRFRVNIFRQRGTLSLAARAVKTELPTIEQLNLPPGIKKIPSLDNGLVLLSGITGSGKSTTLAALIEIINQSQPLHIVTIEDPIEYLYKDEKAIVNQREVGIDVPDFANGLRSVVRQDPDVILVGEMRDAETFEMALMAAETGHLVFGTIHASTAGQTIGRVLDYFPTERHYQIRQLLYFNLRAVIVQKLLQGLRRDIPRVPAVEIMFVNALIKKLIFESEDKKIADAIRTFRHEGMQDFNQSLCDLVKRGLVGEDVAMEASPNPDQLAMNLRGVSFSAGSLSE
ncbi:MAG: PilT/PilU family type 4a pilus ATPase [Planctomycetota bacterium]